MFAAVCCGMQAQRPVGDTIWGSVDTDYFYSIQLDWFYHPEHRDTHWTIMRGDDLLAKILEYPQSHHDDFYDGNYIGGQQWYTDRPIKVIGIAICSRMENPRDTTVSFYMSRYDSYVNYNYSEFAHLFFPNTNDTTMKGRITDSAILYKPRMTADGPSLEKLASAPWRMEQPHRYILFPREDSVYNHRPPYDRHPISPLYEVFFDSAVVVEDSFVVASTAFNNEGDWYSRRVLSWTETMWLWNHPPTRFSNVMRLHNTIIDSTCIAWEKFRQQEWHRFRCFSDSIGWGAVSPDAPPYSYPQYGGSKTRAYPFFPIIEVGFDTVLCHEVSNLRVAERGAGCATLMWDAGDGGPWIVAYGKYDDNWDDFTFDTVTAPMITLMGLEVGTQYFALVRGYCGVTEEYGEWSSPLEVEIYQPWHDPGTEGIDHPGDLGRFTRLVPNPARGEVNVVSSFRLSRIVVYDLSGRKVLEQEADGISTVVDVSGLSSGTYIAALYLPHGVATKKLVVEK